MGIEVIEAIVGDREIAEKLIKAGAEEREPNMSGGQIAVDSLTGDPLVMVAPYKGSMGALRQAFQRFPNSTVLRAAGVRNNAVTFGYTAKTPVMKRYTCRACAVAATHPVAHQIVTRAAAELYEMFFEHLGGVAVETFAMATKAIDREWLMKDSPWTSGVLNTTSPLPYHYDRNNMPGWSAMVVARRGVRGGHLHIPQLDLTIECRDGDVVYFPGWKYLHGVTPMKMVTGDAYRFTAVYYTISKMVDCLDPTEELAAGRKQRTEAEDGMVARQRADGMMRD